MSFDLGDDWESIFDNGIPEPTAADVMFDSFIYASDLDDIAEPEPLIHNTLFMNSLAWLIGKPGHGKSFIAVDIAGHVATGETWAGCPTKQGTVMYLVAEGGSGMRMRVRTWEKVTGHRIERRMALKTAAVQVMDPGPWAAFVEATTRLDPVLIVVDTQARVTVGMEENSARDMGMFVSRLDQLRLATGACVLIVHHQGRGDGEHMRGSTAMDGAADTVISVKKDGEMITVKCDKQKELAPFEALQFQLKEADPSAYVSPMGPLDTLSSFDTPVVAAGLRRWWDSDGTEFVSVAYLVEREYFSKSRFHDMKQALIRKGLVEAKGEGVSRRYSLMHCPY
jgi:hypothetical protein